MRLKSPWKPRLATDGGSVYARLAAALSDDIADGLLPNGSRLPAHRTLAHELGIGLGTVTKAYLSLERRGLVRSEYGRGMFVAGVPRQTAEIVDLSINLPPVGLSDRMLSASLQAVSRHIDAKTFSAYQPVAGRDEDRRALAAWISHSAYRFAADDVFMTHGAQHALSLAFSLAAKPGGTMITEAVTFPGAIQLARHLGLKMHGAETDEEGLSPRALKNALRNLGRSAFVYTTPTLHNPTGRTQSLERRQELANICRKHGITIVEDEIYGPLLKQRPRPLTSLAPERTLHVAGLSKALCPGLRIGVLVVPAHLRRKASQLLEASATMSSPLSGAIMQRWFADGTAQHVLDAIRHESDRRQALATKVLQLGPETRKGFHFFLEISGGRAEYVREAAVERGVLLTPPSAVAVDTHKPLDGIRVCLGGPSMAALKDGLERLRDVIADKQSGIGRKNPVR